VPGVVATMSTFVLADIQHPALTGDC